MHRLMAAFSAGNKSTASTSNGCKLKFALERCIGPITSASFFKIILFIQAIIKMLYRVKNQETRSVLNLIASRYNANEDAGASHSTEAPLRPWPDLCSTKIPTHSAQAKSNV